jgi:hypothetical protein
MEKRYSLHDMMKVLARAQETYGYANQVAVAAEECNELAIACLKYVRYPDHQSACAAIRNKIVEETADVVIILNHLYMIFNISPEEQQRIMNAKLARVERWLDTSSEFVQSTIDREVKTKQTCGECAGTLFEVDCNACKTRR